MLTFTAIAIIKWESPVALERLGIAMAVLGWCSKEFFDLYVKKSKFSVGDIIADVLGIAIAFLIVGV